MRMTVSQLSFKPSQKVFCEVKARTLCRPIGLFHLVRQSLDAVAWAWKPTNMSLPYSSTMKATRNEMWSSVATDSTFSEPAL